MKRAADQIDPNMLYRVTPIEGLTSEWHMKQQQNAREYLDWLRNGRPVVRAHKPYHRAITVAFAANLSTEHRDEWLARCMALATGPFRDMLKTDTLKPRVNHSDIAECVFNLASDANLRMNAQSLWDRMDAMNHDLAAARYEKGRYRTRDSVPTGRRPPPPTRKPVPRWQQ
jgi:hypothetical protein